jgi:uncharacterized DUF497 family protein
MRFAWDERKNRQNRRKHGVSFALAQEVFFDPFCLTVSDRVIDGEQRFWTVGRVEALAILVVVHTVRDEHSEEVIRILSARKATPRERRFYEGYEDTDGS